MRSLRLRMRRGHQRTRQSSTGQLCPDACAGQTLWPERTPTGLTPKTCPASRSVSGPPQSPGSKGSCCWLIRGLAEPHLHMALCGERSPGACLCLNVPF